MGCGPPSKYEHIYSTVAGIGEFKRDFTALGISEGDVGKLFWIFCKIDTDGSRLIEIIELLMFLDVERTRFTKRIFSIFDDDQSGKIDFREFVLSVWNYCTLGKLSLILFAFDIYDQDKSGYIDLKEAQSLVKDVYGQKYELNVHAKRVSAKLDELNRQNIDIGTFQKFAEKHQALLYPAFEMQSRIQGCVLGTTFWHALIDNRVKMFDDRYIPIQVILEKYEERMDLKLMRRPSKITQDDAESPAAPVSNTSGASNPKLRRQSTTISNSHSHVEDQSHEDVAPTADGHESVKSLSKKLSMKSISVAPVVVNPHVINSEEINQKIRTKPHGLTADGMTSAHPVLQRKPSMVSANAQRRSSLSAMNSQEDNPRNKFKAAAQAVAVTTEKKRRKSEFRH